MKHITAYTSISLILLGLLTTNNNFINANADLPPPASYDLAYVFVDNPSPAPDYFALIAPFYEKNGLEMPYTRTSDGIYFNYTRTFNNALSDRIPLGLEITHTFNRSNTFWSGIGGGYYPSSSTIGSNNTVGAISSKIYLQIDNQTNKDYILHLDFSSSGSSGGIYRDHYNELPNHRWFMYDTSALRVYYIPAFTKYTINSDGTAEARYFDAWYLQDLGVSSAYTNGYLDGDVDGFQDGFDLGYQDGLIDGYQDGLEALETSSAGLFDILGNVFGAVGTVFGIFILPGINIGMLVFIPLIFTLLLFILKIVRGGS